MLKNLLVDMGGVLIDFAPARIVETMVSDEDDRALLLRTVYRSPQWCLLDWGIYDEPDLESYVKRQLPERLHTIAHELIFDWNSRTPCVAGMAELMRDCSNAGLRLVLLSNASRRLNAYWPTLPGYQYFDGKVVSADVMMVKPMPEIFRYALDKFNLNAEDTMFVDDVALNISGAMRVGLKSHHFIDGADGLRAALRAEGINI